MHKINKRLKAVAVPALMVMMAAMLIVPAAAMDFSVRPVLPENQRQTGSAFFDLLVEPGQEQDLVIEIGNTSDAEITVLVEVITASTSRGGEINYTSRGLMDDSLKYSFEEIVNVPESHYTIPGGETIQVPIRLAVPEDPFDGTILGSIRVLREATDEEREAAGAIVNQYAYVTAVRLTQSEEADAIPADFALGEITTELINYRASIVAQIRNTQPIIVKGASATAAIYEKGGRTVLYEHNLESLDFAPNSVFRYSFVDSEGYGVEAGDYTARIEIVYEGKTWSFEQDFTIEPQAAAELNEGALNQTGQQRPSEVPLWAIIAIAVGGLATIAILSMAVVISRKKVVAY